MLLALLMSSLVLLGAHGSSLALRSSVNQGEQYRAEALAQVVLSAAQQQLRQRQAELWRDSDGRWRRYRAWFSPVCGGGLCAGSHEQAGADFLSGHRHDTALRYDGYVGARVVRAPRYAWILLGQLPDGRLSYRVVVRAWGVDHRTVVTLNVAYLLPPPDKGMPQAAKKTPPAYAHALGE